MLFSSAHFGRGLCVLLILMVTCCGDLRAQSDVASQKKELQRLRSSILSTQKRLAEVERQEGKTKRSLQAQQRRRHEVAVFVAELQSQLTRLQDSARVVESTLLSTQATLKSIEQSYNNVALQLLEYKSQRKGMPPSKNNNDIVFKNLSTSLAKYRKEMLSLTHSLEATKDLLTDYTETQQLVLNTKQQEDKALRKQISKNSAEIDRIRADKTKLSKQLAEKRSSIAKMQAMINDLVVKERKKAQEERNRNRSKDAVTGPSSNDSEFRPVKSPIEKKSLPWPTGGRSLVHGYGTYKSPETGTILDNPGIDIKQGAGGSVKSVASGTISSVTWLPGYGSVVILDHKNGVRTVYANLATVNVAKGSTVQTGSVIGTSGENIDGDLVHFELWIGKDKQNPLTYLR